MAELKDYSGPELEDYSGEFLSGMNTDELAKHWSKDAIARVVEVSGMLYAGIDGIYTTTCHTKWGMDLAFKLNAELWRRYVRADVRRVREAMNISGDDVEALFKCYQCMPGVRGRMPEAEYDLKNRNHGVLTVKRCRSLEYCVKHGYSALQRHLCEVIDVEGFQNTAHCVNVNIKVAPLKLPKHLRTCWDLWFEEHVTTAEQSQAALEELIADTDWAGGSPIACQWEFKLQV